MAKLLRFQTRLNIFGYKCCYVSTATATAIENISDAVFFFRQLSQRRVRRRLRGWERWTGIIILSASSGLTTMMMMTVVIIIWFRDDCDDDSDDHVYNDLGVRIVHWFCNLEWEERSVGRLKLTSSVTSEIIAIIVIVIVIIMVIMTMTLILITLTLFCINTNPC